jgi:hypothetical protein
MPFYFPKKELMDGLRNPLVNIMILGDGTRTFLKNETILLQRQNNQMAPLKGCLYSITGLSQFVL